MKNKNLHSAKKAKNDEFYTQLSDIENEVRHYRHHFDGKSVFLNCDNPEWSNFWKFFELNFEFLKLKKLTSVHYEADISTYKLEMFGVGDTLKTPLKQSGDFRSDESIAILKEADIVVTNPPFSLFREYIAQLMEYDTKFLVIGSLNAVTYKEIFPLIKDNEMWLGINNVKEFKQPDGSMKKFGNINWYTNLEHYKRNEEIILYRRYNEDEYPQYDNYDAINVDKVADIPKDYSGAMGVPITFLGKYNPDQFEIVGQMANTFIDKNNKGYPFINGGRKYARVLIKLLK